jgi:hypothetical protein
VRDCLNSFRRRLFSPRWKPVNGRVRSGGCQWYSTDFHFCQGSAFDFLLARIWLRVDSGPARDDRPLPANPKLVKTPRLICQRRGCECIALARAIALPFCHSRVSGNPADETAVMPADEPYAVFIMVEPLERRCIVLGFALDPRLRGDDKSRSTLGDRRTERGRALGGSSPGTIGRRPHAV